MNASPFVIGCGLTVGPDRPGRADAPRPGPARHCAGKAAGPYIEMPPPGPISR